jgi:hypothetical protein
MAGWFVPNSSDGLDERQAARHEAQNAVHHTAQTPDENQEIHHLTAVHMVGVELPKYVFSRNTPGRASASYDSSPKTPVTQITVTRGEPSFTSI